MNEIELDLTRHSWKVVYWSADSHGEGSFLTFECIIFKEELEKLMNADTRFIKVLVDDGTGALLAVENINYMERVTKLD